MMQQNQQMQFQSSRPGWDATRKPWSSSYKGFRFQSSRPGWDATEHQRFQHSVRQISILASRVGRDFSLPTSPSNPLNFNPRVPGGTRLSLLGSSECSHRISILASRVGRDVAVQDSLYGVSVFQSSRPGWDATRHLASIDRNVIISILASRVGRDGVHTILFAYTRISILASRVGRDVQAVVVLVQGVSISILASRVGRDRSSPLSMFTRRHFNPRVPGGTRLIASCRTVPSFRFQSSRPGWDATQDRGSSRCSSFRFQSSRPGWDATSSVAEYGDNIDNFNPRVPGGTRPPLPSRNRTS